MRNRLRCCRHQLRLRPPTPRGKRRRKRNRRGLDREAASLSRAYYITCPLAALTASATISTRPPWANSPPRMPQHRQRRSIGRDMLEVARPKRMLRRSMGSPKKFLWQSTTPPHSRFVKGLNVGLHAAVFGLIHAFPPSPVFLLHPSTTPLPRSASVRQALASLLIPALCPIAQPFSSLTHSIRPYAEHCNVVIKT